MVNIGFYEGPVLCILSPKCQKQLPLIPYLGIAFFFTRILSVRETVYQSLGKMAASIAARRAHVFQNCIRSIPVKHALSRAPCIVATSVHHCMKQQDRRQYNTLTNKFKVKEAEIFDLQFHRSSRSRSTHKRRLEIYFFIASLQLIINVTYLI